MEAPALKDVLDRNTAVLMALERRLAQDSERASVQLEILRQHAEFRAASTEQQADRRLDEFKTYVAMRFEHVEARLDEQRKDLNEFRSRIEDRLDALSRWGIGLLVAVFVTVLGAVIRGWH